MTDLRFVFADRVDESGTLFVQLRDVPGAVFDGASGFTLPANVRPNAFFRLAFEPEEAYK